MRKIIIPIIFVAILILGFNKLDVSAQESNFTIVLNPGATNSDSQNPMTPANVTVPAGVNVTWINKDSSPHMLVSGTPDEGPNNIFYGDFFGTGENYTVTFNDPGLYSYYDPAWSHIRGEVTVENPNVSSDQGLSIDTSSAGGIDDSLAVGSNTSDVIGSNSNNFNASEGDFASFPSSSSSSLSSFPSFTTDNTSNQSSILSSIVSDQTLTNIIKKVGPLIGLLMGGSDSSSPLSSPSPLSSSLSLSNESLGVGDFDNQSSFPSSTTQSSSPDKALSNIFSKVGPLLGLLMNGNSSSSSSSPLSSLSLSNESLGVGDFDNQSSFPSSTTQSSSPDKALSNIFSKVGPLLGLLMNGNSSSSSSSPLSSLSLSNESLGVGDFDNQSSFPSSTTQSSSPDKALSNIFSKVGPLLGLLMNGNSSSSSSSPLSSLSQSDGMFGEGLTDTANVSNGESGDGLLFDKNSSSLLDDTFTVQNESITSLNGEKAAVQEELINILRKAYSIGAEIPELPAFLDEGDNATIFIKVNVINPIDKRANASDFPISINFEHADGTTESGYTYANDAGRIEAVPATAYAILATASQTSDHTKDSFVNSYSTSYSKGCSGQIDYMETKDCIITKKYTDMTNNINIDSGN